MPTFFKKYSDNEEEEYKSGMAWAWTIIIGFAIIVSFFVIIGNIGCTTYKCYPSPKSKDYARLIKVEKVKDSCQLTWRRGFQYFSTICPCDSFKVGKYYSI